jgi:pimeloyl-ACP methyl ester carboxylesterase
VNIVDHQGNSAIGQRATVNGVRLHYRVAGEGEPVLLLHGVPKTSYYWRKVLPLLTRHHTVVMPDMRGLGDSEHAEGGYDMATVAEDFAELMAHLGHDRYRVAGEDRGAAAAYQLAAQHPDRVTQLVYQEMILSGFGLEDYSFLTTENVASYVWLWHINFYAVPEFPEMLISGHEREYFSYFIKHEAQDPAAISEDAIDEYVRCYSSPGGLRSMANIYRATLTDGKQNREAAKTPLEMPVLAVASDAFIGADNERVMREVATDVRSVSFPYGHQLAEECPADLASAYLTFFSGHAS